MSLAPNLTITPCVEMALDRGTDAEIGRLLDTAFGEGFDGCSYDRQRHHLRLLARDGARLVGHLALGLRAIRYGSALRDVITVAEVAVHPDAEGRGLGSALVAAAIAEAQGSLATHMLLFGTSGIYARAGFRTVTNPMRLVSLTGGQTGAVTETTPDCLMVRDLTDTAWDAEVPIDLLGDQF